MLNPLTAMPRRAQLRPGKSCEHCGRPIAPKRTGRPPRFCSNRCRQAAFRTLTPASRYDGRGPARNGVIRAQLRGCDTATALGHSVTAYTPLLETLPRPGRRRP